MKSIIITGAAGNVGKVVVSRLASDEHRIHAALGLGENSRIFDETVNKRNIETQFVNLADETVAEGFVNATIIKDPAIDTAILLVGGWQPGSIAETTAYELDQMMKLNFHTAFNVVRPLMGFFERQGGGHFIFVGARPGINPAEAKNQIAYALSKSLVFRLAEIINEQGKFKNIRASIVVPSILDTPVNREALPSADNSEWVSIDSVADSISYLLDESSKNLRETVIKLYNHA